MPRVAAFLSPRAACGLLAAALLAAPAPARAEAPPAHDTVQIALRSLGWSIPIGRMNKPGQPISNLIPGAFPVILDFGGKLTRHVLLGGYLGFNVGLIGDSFEGVCTRNVSCSLTNVRLGIQAQVHLRPHALLNPWIGVGFGTEATTLTVEALSSGSTTGGGGSFQGPEYLHASSGVDYRFHETFGVGPFAALTLGTYDRRTIRNDAGVNKTKSIDDPSIHAWVMVGLRGVLFP